MKKQRNMSKKAIQSVIDLCFPVHMINNPELTNKKHSKLVVGLIPDPNNPEKNRRKVLNYCSPTYGLVPNSAIFPQIEKIFSDNEVSYEATYYHVDDVEFYIEYRVTDERYTWTVPNTNDKIQMIIRVQHSYDSSKVFKVFMGWFRFICDNGLVSPVKEMEDFNLVIVVKHATKIHKSFEVFNQMLVKIKNDAEEIIAAVGNKFNVLAKTTISDESFDDMLKETLSAAGIKPISNSKYCTYADIKARTYDEANHPTLGYNGTVNEWLVYNAINQYINDDTLNVTNPETRLANDSKVLEYLLSKHEEQEPVS